MKTFNLFKAITLALACAALAITTTTPAEAGVIKAHAGTTFVLTPAGGVGRPDCLEPGGHGGADECNERSEPQL
jgi:hypothetical protein